MKRNYIRISVSDLHKTHHFSIRKSVIRYFLYTVLLVCMILALGVLSIRHLSQKVNHAERNVKLQKQKTYALKDNVGRLLQQKDKVMHLLSDKSDELNELASKMSEVEKVLGIFGSDSPQADVKLKQLLANNNKEFSQLESKMSEVEKALGIMGEDGPEADEIADTSGQNDVDPKELEQRLRVMASHSVLRSFILDFIPNGKPIKYRRVSSSFGRRIHPITHKRTKHLGMDFSVPARTPIYAPAFGVIKLVRPSHKGYGNYILMEHAFGFSSLYGHLTKFNVKRGQFIQKGQLIGWSGSTGESTGPHLHYEVRFLNRALDPKNFLSWNATHFYQIFNQEKHVKWEYLIKTMKSSLKVPLQLSLPKTVA